MATYDYDLFVIGAGSGGVRAARLAGALGKRVAVAEESRLGGTCVNRGCIPKKLYAYAAHYADDFEDAAGFGWTVGERKFDWRKLVEAKEIELARLNAIYARVLGDNHVVTITGRATLRDAHTIEIDGQDPYGGNHPGLHRRPAAARRIPRSRAYHHLGRSVRPRGIPETRDRRRRRLYRARIRLDLPRAGRPGRPGLSRQHVPAALRP